MFSFLKSTTNPQPKHVPLWERPGVPLLVHSIGWRDPKGTKTDSIVCTQPISALVNWGSVLLCVGYGRDKAGFARRVYTAGLYFLVYRSPRFRVDWFRFYAPNGSPYTEINHLPECQVRFHWRDATIELVPVPEVQMDDFSGDAIK